MCVGTFSQVSSGDSGAYLGFIYARWYIFWFYNGTNIEILDLVHDWNRRKPKGLKLIWQSSAVITEPIIFCSMKAESAEKTTSLFKFYEYHSNKNVALWVLVHSQCQLRKKIWLGLVKNELPDSLLEMSSPPLPEGKVEIFVFQNHIWSLSPHTLGFALISLLLTV